MSPMGVSPHEKCSPKRDPRDGDGYGGGKDLRLLPSRQGDAGEGVCRASVQAGGVGVRSGDGRRSVSGRCPLPPRCDRPGSAPARGLPVRLVRPAFPPPGRPGGRDRDRPRTHPGGGRKSGGVVGFRPGGRSRGDRGGDPRRVYHRRIGEGRPSPRAGRGGEPPRGGKPPEADRALSPVRGAFPGRGGRKRQDGGSVSCAGAERGGGPPHRERPVAGTSRRGRPRGPSGASKASKSEEAKKRAVTT